MCYVVIRHGMHCQLHEAQNVEQSARFSWSTGSMQLTLCQNGSQKVCVRTLITHTFNSLPNLYNVQSRGSAAMRADIEIVSGSAARDFSNATEY